MVFLITSTVVGSKIYLCWGLANTQKRKVNPLYFGSWLFIMLEVKSCTSSACEYTLYNSTSSQRLYKWVKMWTAMTKDMMVPCLSTREPGIYWVIGKDIEHFCIETHKKYIMTFSTTQYKMKYRGKSEEFLNV